MMLPENVGIEKDEVKPTNSRASRMARYSAAAAGVAAVSTLDVDAAMIKVFVTDTAAQGTHYYALELSAITQETDTKLYLFHQASTSDYNYSFRASFLNWPGSVAVSSLAQSFFQNFSNGATIGVGGYDSQYWWNNEGFITTSSFDGSVDYSSLLLGFRLDEGSSDYINGWLKVTIDGSSSFTLNSYGYNSTLNGAAIAGQGTVAGVAGVPDSGPGIVGLALIGAGAAGVRLWRKLRAGK